MYRKKMYRGGLSRKGHVAYQMALPRLGNWLYRSAYRTRTDLSTGLVVALPVKLLVRIKPFL